MRRAQRRGTVGPALEDRDGCSAINRTRPTPPLSPLLHCSPIHSSPAYYSSISVPHIHLLCLSVCLSLSLSLSLSVLHSFLLSLSLPSASFPVCRSLSFSYLFSQLSACLSVWLSGCLSYLSYLSVF